jgi:zinc transport system substrate-binding protein
MKKYFILVLVSLCFISLWVYFRQAKKTTTVFNPNTLSITTSSYPLEFIARQLVAGDKVVTNLVPFGTDPHEFEPSAKQISGIYDSTIFLFNGADLDPWAEKIQEDLASKGIVPMKAVAGLTLIDGADPHFWLDTDNMTKVANRLAVVLIKLDPNKTQDYQSRLEAFTKSMRSLDDEYATSLATCKQKNLVISHNFFAYPAKKYGLIEVPISGLSPESEPTPKALADIITLIKSQKVGVIFRETLISPKLVESLAQDAGVKVATLNPLEGLSAQDASLGLDYISIMRENLKQLKQGLECK